MARHGRLDQGVLRGLLFAAGMRRVKVTFRRSGIEDYFNMQRLCSFKLLLYCINNQYVGDNYDTSTI